METKPKIPKGPMSPTVVDIPHVITKDDNHVQRFYEFGEKLGEGGFGVVWVVKHKETGERYACKIINKEKAGNQRVKLIEREVGILKKVSHDHIIELKEVFETGRKMYLIMELCEGGELSKLLQRKGTLSNEDARIVMQRLTDAVSYLHKNGTVHRDLKLENILLSRNALDPNDLLYIKVTDFGLSILNSGHGMDRMMDDFCGTPMYMAPEITDCRTYSQECDIWAMGVIMLKLMSGFKDELILDVVKGQDVESELARTQWNILSEAAKDCVGRMLRKNPAHRLTANEILDHDWIQGRQLDKSAKTENVLELMKKFHAEKNGGAQLEENESVVTGSTTLPASSAAPRGKTRPTLASFPKDPTSTRVPGGSQRTRTPNSTSSTPSTTASATQRSDRPSRSPNSTEHLATVTSSVQSRSTLASTARSPLTSVVGRSQAAPVGIHSRQKSS